MGMPVITPSTTTRSQSVTDIVESVALQQTALSHILNAEGEKLQKVIAKDDVTTDELLAVNKSVKTMVDTVARLEFMLQGKVQLFEDVLSQTDTVVAETKEEEIKEEVAPPEDNVDADAQA